VGTDPDSVTLPSAAARALAAVLLDLADVLDEDDLRAADAITDVRLASRDLAEAVFGRGWGDLYLGLDVASDREAEADEQDVEDVFEDVEFGDPALTFGESDASQYEDEGLLLPPGTRITYQARFDYVITDAAAFLRYVATCVPPDGGNPPAPPEDEVEALGTLAYLDGLGSRDYSHVGLEFAGGREVVRPLEETLWEMSHEEQDDRYPFE
jgi:hypothetical protein